MSKVAILLLPMMLGLGSLVCSVTYITQHERAWRVIRETWRSTAPEEFESVVQQRLDAEDFADAELLHHLALGMGVLAVIAGLVVFLGKWHVAMGRIGASIRYANLLAGFGSLLLAMIRV